MPSADRKEINPRSTRERLITAMTDSMQRHGMHGTGITEVLREADAPKGVLYHHFPNGKTELALAAIDASIAVIEGWLDATFEKYPDPLEAIERWVTAASRRLEASRFEAGCPLATIALETTAADAQVRERLAGAFERMRERIREALTEGSQNRGGDLVGISEGEARGLATLIVAAYEGALLQARVGGTTAPIVDTCETLVTLIRSRRGAVAAS